MSESNQRDALWDLIDASCDERLGPEDVERLQRMLDDPEKLDRYLNYFQMHAELHFRIRADHVGRRSLALALHEESNAPFGQRQAAGLLVHESPGPAISFAHESNLRKWCRWFIESPRGRTLAAAAVMLLALGAWWMFAGPSEQLVAQRQRQPIAILAATDQAQWVGKNQPPNGTKFIEGQTLRLVKGRAQISMSSGADVMLRGPCSIVLASTDQIDLEDGLVNVQVADWASGFTVSTESVHVKDLGKRFVVSVDREVGSVEAHAIDGKLRVQATNLPADERHSMLLSSGEAIRLHMVSNETVRLRADERLIESRLDDSQPFKPVPIFNTGRGLVTGDEDPHWRLVSSTADDFIAPSYAVVCKTTRSYLPNDASMSQWISSIDYKHGLLPNSMYTFETEFDLTGYDPTTVTIVAQVLADNGVIAVRLNGQSLALKPWIHNAPSQDYNEFHKVEINGSFVKGINKIQFDVWNGIIPRRSEDRNPMALRVEWRAFGRVLPSPAKTRDRQASNAERRAAGTTSSSGRAS